MGKLDREYFKTLSDVMSLPNQYVEIANKFNHEHYKKLVEISSRAIDPSKTVEEIIKRQAAMYESFSMPMLQYPDALNALEKQWDMLAKIADSYQTPEIIKLHSSLLQNNYSGIYIFLDSLNKTHIEAANVALLKNARVFADFSSVLPKGLSSVVKNLHVDAAKRLSHSDNISFEVSSKSFYAEENPEEKTNVTETNILCSSLHLLSGLDESDLISFLNHLSKYPNLALEHKIGRKIEEIISEWDTLVDFENEFYYHARSLDEDACPYTEHQLLQAPTGVTWHGRYNFVGESHYYFSDKPKGAIIEVAKHSRNSRIQIAKLKPSRSIKMIDLSQEITTQNKFLEYCRFSPKSKDYSNIKREYLLPCFVADCCKYKGIEGIKYYGSKEYTNYVAWKDSYFECVDFELKNI